MFTPALSGTSNAATVTPICGTAGSFVISGGIVVAQGGTLRMENGSVIRRVNGTNVAAGGGGGAAIDASANIRELAAPGRIFISHNALIEDNFTPRFNMCVRRPVADRPSTNLPRGTNGGGIRVASGNHLTIQATGAQSPIIRDNFGAMSGGVHVARMAVDRPLALGGNPAHAPVFTMSDGTITGNVARYTGGGISVNVNEGAGFPFTISGGSITDNRAIGTEERQFVGNVGDTMAWQGGRGGGGITIFSRLANPGTGGRNPAAGIITLNMTRNSLTTTITTVSDNRATAYGGGILATEGSIINIQNNGTLNVQRNNAGMNNVGNPGGRVANGDGGGFAVNGTVNISGNGPLNITDNTATRSGGGINIVGALSVVGAGNIQITRNRAGIAGVGTAALNHGGGINHGGTGAFTFTHTTNPFNVSENHAQGNGGGIHRTSTHATAATFPGHVVISNNSAGQSGGGIHIAAGHYILNGAQVRGNWSTVATTGATDNTGGGGVSVFTGGTITMSSGTIGGTAFGVNSNRAIRGAGVRVAGGTFNFDGGTIGTNVGVNTQAGDAPLATSLGGGVFMSSGLFTMRTTTATRDIYRNRANRGAGVAMIGGTFQAGQNGVRRIRNNELGPAGSTARGGGVYLAGAANFNFTAGGTGNLDIIDNNVVATATTMYGGGVYVSGTAHFNATGNVNIQRNRATHGGGIFVRAGTVTTSGTGVRNVLDNTATLNGGGIHTAGTVTWGLGNIQGNNANGATANNGGGGVFMNGGTFTMTTGLIGSDLAAPATTLRNRGIHGGGVRVIAGTFTFNGGDIGNNIATSAISGETPNGDGGGVHVSGTGVFTMGATVTNRHIHRNRANNGGGVAVVGGTFNVGSNATGTNLVRQIAHNIATNNGGGLYYTSGTVTIPASAVGFHIQDNTAANGGGIHVGGTTTAHFDLVNQALSVRQNTASVQGGGIDVTATGRVTINHASALIYNNNVTGGTATANGGGGVNVRGNADRTAANASFTLANGQIGINSPLNTAGGRNRGLSGGGIRLVSGFVVHSGGRIQSNRATNLDANVVNAAGRGGGVYIAGGTFQMGGTGPTRYIRNNHAPMGGGVYIRGGTLTIQDSGINDIRGNVVTSVTSGAGIHQSGGIVNMAGATSHIRMHNAYAGTTAAGSNAIGGPSPGSGVYMTAGTFNMTGGFITSNRTEEGTNTAGGVSVVPLNATTAATFNMSGTSRIGGTAANDNNDNRGVGGGVNVTGDLARVNMTGGNITFNNSRVGGGGVVVANAGATGGQFHMGGAATTSVSNNTTPTQGGGFWVGNNGQLHLTNGTGQITINNNTAQNDPPPPTQPTGSGGGIQVGPNALVESTAAGGVIQVNNNIAATNGGGIHQTGGTVNWRRGIIQGNFAQGNIATAESVGTGTQHGGGGVFMTGTSTFNMYGGSIGAIQFHELDASTTVRNRGLRGGGVHMRGGTFNLNGGGIGANIATNVAGGIDPIGYGGGLYMNAGTFTFGGALSATIVNTDIYSNFARYGGGVRMTGGTFNMGGGTRTLGRRQVGRNFATNAGGGISMAGAGAIVYMDGVGGIGTPTIQRNHAPRGGGVHMVSGSFNMGIGPVASAAAAEYLNYNNYGYIGEAPDYYYNEDGVIGIAPMFASPNGVLILDDGIPKIVNNTAALYGGGVYLAADIPFDMHRGSISGNWAQFGGGMHGLTGTFNLSGTGAKTINRNVAEYNGGGVWIGRGASITTQNATFTENRADGDGSFNPLLGPLGPSGDPVGTYVGMGGAIFTENYCYNNPLILAAPYSNITIQAGTVFRVAAIGNTAYAPYAPPSNALSRVPTIPSGLTTSVYSHPINNYDINFRGIEESEPFEFEFIKTDDIINPQEGNRLEGAGFQLYWRPDSDSDWEEEGGPVFSDSDGVVALTLRTIGQHRLIEVTPPPGFTAPLGYWIIHVEAYDDGHRVYRIESYAGNPLFEQEPRDTWWVGNGFDFNLPLSGGAGTMLFTALGVAFVGFAVTMLFITRKKDKKKPSTRY